MTSTLCFVNVVFSTAQGKFAYDIFMPNLNEYLNKFATIRVLCVGDVMLDRFIYGKVERISPEAPFPIFKKTDEVSMLGGVGNVAANIASLGAKASIVSRLGNDKNAKRIIELVGDAGIAAYPVQTISASTTTKTRIVSSNTHILRIDNEDIIPLSESEFAKVLPIIEKEIPMSDIVVISDYGKGFITKELVEAIVGISQKKGIPVVVDPKGNDFSKYNGTTIVKPNLKEFETVSGVKVDVNSEKFTESLINGAKNIFSKASIKGLLITLGGNGMFYIAPDGQYLYSKARTRKVYDVSGAGDTSLSALALLLAAGGSIEDSMDFANMAAGIAVSKPGTAIVTAAELEKEYSDTIHCSSEKIFDRRGLERILNTVRGNGYKIGFTNGCFDLLHMGHIYSIEQAKNNCDFLVVGVNSDASVRRLKGPQRPIQDEKTRATVLASLSCVDAVCIFEEDTALNLVKLVHPDVIAKEGYELDKWEEAAFVNSYGGSVLKLKRLEGFSTSSTIEKMNQSKK